MSGEVGVGSEEDHVRRLGVLVPIDPRGEVLCPPWLALIPVDEDERNPVQAAQLGWFVQAKELASGRRERVGNPRCDEELSRDEDGRQREPAA